MGFKINFVREAFKDNLGFVRGSSVHCFDENVSLRKLKMIEMNNKYLLFKLS